MKSGWSILPFDEVLTDVTGGNVKTLQSAYAEIGAFPIIDQGQRLIGGYTDDRSNLCRASTPAIVFGDHTRALKWIDFPFCLGADGTKILTVASEHDPKYIFYYLRSLNIPSAGYSRHFKFLKAAPIVVPPLREQKRIAAILDQANGLRQMRRGVTDTFERLANAVFYEMFGNVRTNDRGWPEGLELADLCDVASGITKGRKLNGMTTRPVPYMTVATVQDGFLKLDTVRTIEASDKEIERYQLRANDILLTEGGDPDKLGRGALWNDEIAECIHQNHVFRVRIKDERLHPTFAVRLLGSARGKSYFLRSAKQTTGIASINSTQLKAFPLLLPPIDMQNAFAARLEAITKERCKVVEALAQTESLFASLQHRAFRGEL